MTRHVAAQSNPGFAGLFLHLHVHQLGKLALSQDSHLWLVVVGLVCGWTAINPKVFPPPPSLDHWASKAVLGETYWANRKKVPYPRGTGSRPTS